MLRKYSLTLSLVLVVAVPLLLFGAGSSRADYDHGGGAVKLLALIPVPVNPVTNPNGNLFASFDISWVDAATQRYFLADRSNAVVDVVDAKAGTFLRQIKGGFQGFTGNNDTSGPNGVTVSGNLLFVTDAPSRVVAIDLSRNDAIVGEAHTGGADNNRADELAFDPRDRLILAVNNADSPPFASLITVDASGGLKANTAECGGSVRPPCRITFSNFGPNRDTATNGAEQPVWEPKTGRFYISIPELNHVASDGAVARINPNTGAVEAVFHVTFCAPAGLTVGPQQDLLVGCSVIFDTAGKVWDPTNPKSVAKATQIIIDATTGKADATVLGVGGSDEVWFNRGDGRYYTASRNNPTGPVLGVIDAERQTLIQIVPTVNAKVPAKLKSGATVLVNGTAHSVAANPHNNLVFVPLPANNIVFDGVNDCTGGCIAVYGTPSDGRGEGDRD